MIDTKDNRVLMIGLFIIYEIVILFLLMGAIIPQGMSFLDFWANPILYIQKVDQYAIALTLALFLPLVYRKIDSLKLGAAEVKLRDVEEVKDEIKEVKQDLSVQRFDYDRALFAIISRLNRQLEVGRESTPQAAAKRVLQLGAMDFVESWITAEIIYQHLEQKTLQDQHQNVFEIKRPESRETTLMTFFNLLSGKIDFFIWYSGTGLAMAGMGVVPHDHSPEGIDKLNQIYDQWGLKWLPSIGFENREGPAMLSETAERMKIEDMSDLAEEASNLVFGANREYFMRSWAYPYLKSMGIKFKAAKEVDINNRLSGLLNKDFDVGIIYDTDPEIKDKRYKKIKWEGEAHDTDPGSKKARSKMEEKEGKKFPPIYQYAMPLCRKEHASMLQAALDDLKISVKNMIDMKSEAAKRANYDDITIEIIAKKFFK